jgi:hypothetical protein
MAEKEEGDGGRAPHASGWSRRTPAVPFRRRGIFPYRPRIFTHSPLIRIAINSRDPSIFVKPPSLDNISQIGPWSEAAVLSAPRSICHGDGFRAGRRHGLAGDLRLHVLVLLR